MAVGAECEITAGEWRGRTGTLVTVDEDGDAYVRLAGSSGGGGKRAVVPVYHLKPVVVAASETVAVGEDGGCDRAEVEQVKVASSAAAIIEDAHAMLAASAAQGEAEEEIDEAAVDAVEEADGDGGCAVSIEPPTAEACLEALREWPEGAHAAAAALM